MKGEVFLGSYWVGTFETGSYPSNDFKIHVRGGLRIEELLEHSKVSGQQVILKPTE